MSEKYCALQEHQQQIRICLIENCDEVSRYICKQCNSKQFHSHNQQTDNHLVDLEQILLNQEALKEQQYQYHKKTFEISNLLHLTDEALDHLEQLRCSLLLYINNYVQYIRNVIDIRIQIDSKEIYKTINGDLAQIIMDVINYDEDQLKNQIYTTSHKLTEEINEINQQIQDLRKQQQNKQLLLIDNEAQINFALISPDSKYLYYGSNKQLFYYDISQQERQQICSINDLCSFQISKDFQLFYFGNLYGFLQVYNKNKNKQIVQYDYGSIKNIGYSKFFQQFRFIYHKFEINEKNIQTIQQISCDMIYDEQYNILITAQKHQVNVIRLDYQIKQKIIHVASSNIINIQYDQNLKQLLILQQEGLLSAYTLQQHDESLQFQSQINPQIKNIRYFKYYDNNKFLIFITESEILILNAQGQMIDSLMHSLSKVGICPYDELVYFNNFCSLSYSHEHIVLQTADSVSLFKLSEYQ